MFSLLKNKVLLSVVGILLSFALSFSLGWKVHSYYVGYQQNIERVVKDEVKEGLSQIQKDHAQNLLDTQKKLDNIKSNVVVERIPTFIDRPVYLNGCIDEDGAGTLHDFKLESNKAREERRGK